MLDAATTAQSSNFELKKQVVDLLGAPVVGRASVTLDDLEAIRTRTAVVPASRSGLETICGASCETGAH
jgi:hypothetical protein